MFPVKGVQVAMSCGIAATGAAKPGIPGASSPAPAEGAAAAQRDDASGTLPPGGPRLATAVPKAPVPAGSAQTEPSGAGAAELAPGATEGAASQAAGDLASLAGGPAFLMPAMPAEAPSPGTGAPALSQAASPMHATTSLPTPDQLRPAFAAAASATGPSHVIVRLDPAELGRVQVGILRQPDGPSRIELVAERPETLQLLMRDQPALHRALDLAGVPAEGRTLHFQVGSPDPARDPSPTPATQSGLAGGNLYQPPLTLTGDFARRPPSPQVKVKGAWY
jgi:flagellar hook-length control protein FliK